MGVFVLGGIKATVNKSDHFVLVSEIKDLK